jgi:D-alanyl-D-alanine dipeptidase
MRLVFPFLLLVFFSTTNLLQAQNATAISDTTFVNLKDYSADFVYDMKYATTDNFLKAKVYDLSLIHI